MSHDNQALSSSELPATGDQTLSIQQFRGNPLVIYFYPRDNTPGCTRESQDFRDRHADFAAAGCAVLGVSRDSLKSHENFSAKHDFPFALISDADEELCRRFDVIKEKNMYGKKVLGIERSTFLLDAQGRIASEWRKVKVPGHVDEVLEAVRALG
ncbi:MAG: peroxiredoxin [Gammaproteobacteria bacterium HGW-Gammaproteobacteria-8]|nr:MAG: peroxiredoxin [Gammaproteobacteria bacterium HGW-Gammaproteobacteria-8]